MSGLIGKVWGTTEVLIKTPLFEAHRLKIRRGTQCSLHMHRAKWNAFFVLSGVLQIEVQKNDYDLVDVTELRAGEATTVRPGEYHRFIAGKSPVIAIEVYYPDHLSEDIVRKNVGGLVGERVRPARRKRA